MSAEKQWRHGCVLAGCWPAMETWVRAGQQWRHGCVLVGCWLAMETWVRAGWLLAGNGDMDVCLFAVGQ